MRLEGDTAEDSRSTSESGGHILRQPKAVAVAVAIAAALVAFAAPAAAHAAGLRDAGPSGVEVPTWLFLTTGGGAVGASFLLSSFVTDRAFIRSVHAWGATLPAPGQLARWAIRALGIGLLVVTVYVGFVGPPTGYRNFAILFVWVVWWGGYVASTYLIGNTWPTLNPFRTVAELLPTLDVNYPDRLGSWPSVVGLLAVIWIEVVSPLADDPRALATAIVVYGTVTVSGAVTFGTSVWFRNVDPISRAFACFGRAAPIERTDSGLSLRLPGTALSADGLVEGRADAAFVIALLYVTTFDGFVATWLWRDLATWLVGAGLPPLFVYFSVYLLGYGAFLTVFQWAIGRARSDATTFRSRAALLRRFAPSFLAIAAGYHLAHNLVVLIGLAPAVIAVGAAPLSPPQQPPVLASVPGWLTGVELAFVLVGHFLAVWVAHAIAYELFPARMDAIRSQYGITLVMVAYTVISLWIVTTPIVEPPFLAGESLS